MSEPSAQSNIMQTRSELEQIKEGIRELVAISRGNEAMIDTLCQIAERIEDAVTEIAWYSLPFWQRWRMRLTARTKLEQIINDPSDQRDVT